MCPSKSITQAHKVRQCLFKMIFFFNKRIQDLVNASAIEFETRLSLGGGSAEDSAFYDTEVNYSVVKNANEWTAEEKLTPLCKHIYVLYACVRVSVTLTTFVNQYVLQDGFPAF